MLYVARRFQSMFPMRKLELYGNFVRFGIHFDEKLPFTNF